MDQKQAGNGLSLLITTTVCIRVGLVLGEAEFLMSVLSADKERGAEV